MKVLVIGSGGREHGLCWKLSGSDRVDKIYCAPGNGGTAELAENVDIQADDIDALLEFALDNEIDLTIVGPEDPLVLGIVDRFEENGLKIFGANKKSAQLEGSKDFSKRFMEKHKIASAKYRSYSDYEEAVKGLDEFSYPLVIKADGLCLGKGVVICDSREVAVETLDDILNKRCFGNEGSSVVIEEFLDGIEASLLCFVSKGKVIPMESAKDYKKIYDGDKGPNTGGVGCYSPSPLFTQELKDKINTNILQKIVNGLEEDDLYFSGILFVGLMIVDSKPMVLEFNVRFGDPETEVLMPRLESDLLDLIEKSLDGTIEPSDLVWKDEVCLTVVTTSDGYPGAYEKGFKISGLDDLEKGIIVFHNGTKYIDNELVTNGGRVMSITALGDTMEVARNKIYKNIGKIDFQGINYRKDIGQI
ncbi:MAG TPA: phosphoribosylamine--glycine ligase [Tissierellaceae bacterium]|nr:phosphoribosylamine--glycine ligase [Tissierellaceae bacterium]